MDSGACVACAPGTQNAAGDPLFAADGSAGPDTTCSAWLCAENERVAEYACVACAPGKTNAAGNDASVANADTSVQWTAPSDSTFPAPGTYTAGVNTFCAATVCAVDEYVSDEHACTACPAGTTNALHSDMQAPETMVGDDASGVATSCDATRCAADQLVSGNACAACPAGTTNAAGDDASGGDTVCDTTICDENEHVSGNACTACPVGTVRPAGDAASDSCSDPSALNEADCLAGGNQWGADTTCDVCAKDFHVSGGSCTACATGTQHPGGDVAGDADTTCERCDENYHVVGNACVACAAGSTNNDNDLAAGADTPCVATICAREQYVSGNVCVDCPPGTVNLHDHDNHGANTGDDATQADTTCTAVMCSENERVSGNTCVPCNTGFVSAEGADQSQADTTCSWDGSYCAVHTILAAGDAYCKAADGSTVVAADEATCEGPAGVPTGNLWTRHTYTLPKWANGAGTGLKAPSDCVADNGSTDCDIYDAGTDDAGAADAGAACIAYTPVSAAPHCLNANDVTDISCDSFDYSEERCLGYGDCYALDGTTACDGTDAAPLDGTSSVREGDRAACLAAVDGNGQGCLFQKAAATSGNDGTCSWGGAATCAFTSAEDFADGENKKCDSCPLGVSTSGRPCSCALACSF